MGDFLRSFGVCLALAVVVLVMVAPPAWALVSNPLPGPGLGILAGAAVVAALVIAKLWRGK